MKRLATLLGLSLALIAAPASQVAANDAPRGPFAIYSLCVAAVYVELASIGDTATRYASSAVYCERQRNRLLSVLQNSYERDQAKAILIGIDQQVRKALSGR